MKFVKLKRKIKQKNQKKTKEISKKKVF